MSKESNVKEKHICDNARVSDNAKVSGNAKVRGEARVYGDAEVGGDAVVSGNAVVRGRAHVYGNAEVFGHAVVSGRAMVFGTACIGGTAEIRDTACIGGTAEILGGIWDGSEGAITEGTWLAPMHQARRPPEGERRMSEEAKPKRDLIELLDGMEALRGRAMVQLLDENIRVRAELDTVKKERDEARRSVEEFRDVLWGKFPMEVDPITFGTTQKERDEARAEAEAMRRHAQHLARLGGAFFQPPSFPWENEE